MGSHQHSRRFGLWLLAAFAAHIALAALAARLTHGPLVFEQPTASLSESLFELAPELISPDISPRGREPLQALAPGGAVVKAPSSLRDTSAQRGAVAGGNGPTNPRPSSSGVEPLAVGSDNGPTQAIAPRALGPIDLNLSQREIRAVVGEGELERMVASDARRRTAERQEWWAGADFDRWRHAIEGYVPSVRVGNQHPLGEGKGSFIRYLNGMAARIAPLFVDGFVSWIRSLPVGHPLRRPHLSTRLEIVLEPSQGHIVRMGVVLASGVTAFDIGALDSVKRASPFGSTPESIVSPDGRVYIQWDLHNDEYTGCTVENARPSIVGSQRPAASE
jgi:hypothetical protein